MSERLVLAPFAGAGGGCLGAHALGLSTVGIENDRDCCATRSAAGLATIRQDVTTFDASHLLGRVFGLIGSPPCTDFSKAGRRRGLTGETGPLVWEPLRLVSECLPEWIALEQVPEVLPIWHEVARHLSELGYSAWVGVLDAADYGLPQNRKRAILIARRGSVEVRPPEPTHSRSGHDEMFSAREKWVSMGDALGWDRGCVIDTRHGGVPVFSADQPARCVTSTVGKNSWLLNTRRDQREDGTTQVREFDSPSPSVSTKAGGQWVYERPATTVMGDTRIFPPDGHHPYQGLGSYSKRAIPVTLDDLAALQSFPAGYPFQGNKTSVSRQIGNAWPALFAQAVIGAACGLSHLGAPPEAGTRAA